MPKPYLLLCRECDRDWQAADRLPLVLPFDSNEERARWAAAHSAGTGHDWWWAHDGYLPRELVRDHIAGNDSLLLGASRRQIWLPSHNLQDNR